MLLSIQVEYLLAPLLGIEPSHLLSKSSICSNRFERHWYLVLELNQRLRFVRAMLIPSANQAFNLDPPAGVEPAFKRS